MSYTPGPLPKPYAHQAFWPDWDQWHDSSDPLPAEWDDEPPTDVVLVFTASQMQTHTAAEVARAVAAERERWTELVQSLVACHEEPSCPAVEWARDVIRDGWSSVPAEEPTKD